jgi:nucleoside triphosphate pyrophosphatase
VGLRVAVVPSAYVERPIEGAGPAELALAHANGKAAGAAPSDRLIIAADTVVDVDGDPLGKPVDAAEARAMLTRLAGRWHHVHTAFVLRDDATAASLAEVVTTRVKFADLDDETISAYAASGDGMDKAGAYGIQGFAATLVERIDGDYFAVVGFPLSAFAQALPRLGYVMRPQTIEVPA